MRKGELYIAEYGSVIGSGKKHNARVTTQRQNSGTNNNHRLWTRENFKRAGTEFSSI